MRRCAAGFTLLELLVAVGLAIILVSVMAMVFFRSTDTVMNQEARIAIVSNARVALDKVDGDAANVLPSASGQQRFTMINGGSGEIDGARDYLGFATVTGAPGGPEGRRTATVYEELFLAAETDDDIGNGVGTSSTMVRSGRTLRVLRRRLWKVVDSSALALVDALAGGDPLDPAAATKAGMVLIEEGNLCHWVASMNIDIPENGRYFALDDPSNPVPAASMPIGAPGKGTSLPHSFRITLRVIEGAPERAERVVSRVIWIPME